MTHQFAWTHQPDERGAIRLLAAHLLLEGCEQAVSKGPRIGEDPVQAEGASFRAGPRPSPPARRTAETRIIERAHSVNYALS